MPSFFKIRKLSRSLKRNRLKKRIKDLLLLRVKKFSFLNVLVYFWAFGTITITINYFRYPTETRVSRAIPKSRVQIPTLVFCSDDDGFRKMPIYFIPHWFPKSEDGLTDSTDFPDFAVDCPESRTVAFEKGGVHCKAYFTNLFSKSKSESISNLKSISDPTSISGSASISDSKSTSISNLESESTLIQNYFNQPLISFAYEEDVNDRLRHLFIMQLNLADLGEKHNYFGILDSNVNPESHAEGLIDIGCSASIRTIPTYKSFLPAPYDTFCTDYRLNWGGPKPKSQDECLMQCTLANSGKNSKSNSEANSKLNSGGSSMSNSGANSKSNSQEISISNSAEIPFSNSVKNANFGVNFNSNKNSSSKYGIRKQCLKQCPEDCFEEKYQTFPTIYFQRMAHCVGQLSEFQYEIILFEAVYIDSIPKIKLISYFAFVGSLISLFFGYASVDLIQLKLLKKFFWISRIWLLACCVGWSIQITFLLRDYFGFETKTQVEFYTRINEMPQINIHTPVFATKFLMPSNLNKPEFKDLVRNESLRVSDFVECCVLRKMTAIGSIFGTNLETNQTLDFGTKKEFNETQKSPIKKESRRIQDKTCGLYKEYICIFRNTKQHSLLFGKAENIQKIEIKIEKIFNVTEFLDMTQFQDFVAGLYNFVFLDFGTDISRFGFFEVLPQNIYSIELSESQIRRLPPPFDTGCHDYESRESAYSSQYDCIQKCVLETLGCLANRNEFLPIEELGLYLECPSNLTIVGELSEECRKMQCPTSCVSKFFRIEMRVENVEDVRDGGSNSLGELESLVVIEFPNRIDAAFVHQPKMTFSDFFYEFGGLNCLWFGIDFIRFYKLIRFLFKRVKIIRLKKERVEPLFIKVR